MYVISGGGPSTQPLKKFSRIWKQEYERLTNKHYRDYYNLYNA